MAKCFVFLTKQLQKLRFGVLKACCHFIKIVVEDVEVYASSVEEQQFYTSILAKGINISNLDESVLTSVVTSFMKNSPKRNQPQRNFYMPECPLNHFIRVILVIEKP